MLNEKHDNQDAGYRVLLNSFLLFFIHLKLVLLAQFTTSNDEK